jgi:hypothetical protein
MRRQRHGRGQGLRQNLAPHALAKIMREYCVGKDKQEGEVGRMLYLHPASWLCDDRGSL